MTNQKLQKIKNLTGYSLNEIIEMSEKDFVLKIVRFRATWMTQEQQEFFERARKDKKHYGLEQNVLDALEIFNGKLL